MTDQEITAVVCATARPGLPVGGPRGGPGDPAVERAGQRQRKHVAGDSHAIVTVTVPGDDARNSLAAGRDSILWQKETTSGGCGHPPRFRLISARRA
jgi:hypothetical protein